MCVLALWPETGIWTSVLYPATVVKTPSDTGTVDKLMFEGAAKTTNVPPGFAFVLPLYDAAPRI
jgi:hypothetical protein